MPKPHLITIGPSHYCDKARWGLDRAGIAYVEDAHLPVLHYGAALLRRGQRTVPILVTPHGTIRNSSAILRHADKFVKKEQRLFPTEDLAGREVEELVDLFDEKLGPATRRVAYFHLLDDENAISSLSGPRIARSERALFQVVRPAIVAFLRRGLRIYRDPARRSEERIAAVFDEVEAKLARGGRYLVGDRLTAADVTFAALAAPVLLPPEYGWPMPSIEGAPPEMRALVDGFRRRPAGVFGMRLYREERSARPG